MRAFLCASVTAVLFSAACSTPSSSGSSSGSSGDGEVSTFEVDGHAQKGPFVNGASLSVSELDGTLTPTGRVFNTTIADDTGSFDLEGVELTSSFARLTADGFYFDENRGELSAARLELHAVADLTNAASVNVNLLSHLERPRVEYLISEGQSFGAAKATAQAEVLAVFGIDGSDMPNSEELDISLGRDADAKLLAVSVLLQGYRSVGQLTELLSAIGTDLRTDGVLDSATSGSALVNAAVLVDMAEVRSNIETRYESLGVAAQIGAFEPYVMAFRDGASWDFTEFPAYPTDVPQGDNLLAEGQSSYAVAEHTLAADLPRGTSLTAKLIADPGTIWFYSDPGQWDVGTFDGTQTFTALVEEGAVSMTLFVDDPGRATLEYYENGSEQPTRTKTIQWTCDGQSCTCGPEEVWCDGACISTKEDSENCGECGKPCPDGYVCQDRACVMP